MTCYTQRKLLPLELTRTDSSIHIEKTSTLTILYLRAFFTPQVRHLIEGGAYLKIGRSKEILPFNLRHDELYPGKKFSPGGV